jgi:hypothetical protein
MADSKIGASSTFVRELTLAMQRRSLRKLGPPAG